MPRQLVESGEARRTVWVADQAAGVARRRAVKLGGTAGELVEVVEGLTPADKLIAGGREGLRDGERITVVGEERRHARCRHAQRHRSRARLPREATVTRENTDVVGQVANLPAPTSGSVGDLPRERNEIMGEADMPLVEIRGVTKEYRKGEQTHHAAAGRQPRRRARATSCRSWAPAARARARS